jgi:hypothetical protein
MLLARMEPEVITRNITASCWNLKEVKFSLGWGARKKFSEMVTGTLHFISFFARYIPRTPCWMDEMV